MIPLTRPNPPRLSEHAGALQDIEASGLYSNFGPANARFEQQLVATMFGGEGACLTTCNATLGLMLAIRHAIGEAPSHGRYALMPSFTFAAAAQAALWCGLTPLFCDIEPASWTADAAEEEALLREYGEQIAVVVPYATFGADLDLARYTDMMQRVPVVVDAAASLGTIAADGRGFGTGFPGTIIFSMHATKSFSTGEGGVIYSANPELIGALRTMCNFGFGQPRTATMAGLNAKLSEVAALTARLRLESYQPVVETRAALMELYRRRLPGLTFQSGAAPRQAHQFVPALLPPHLATSRDALQARLKERGIGMATYFSPHVAEQAYFRVHGVAAPLPVTEYIASRVISLPLYDTMTAAEVAEVARAVVAELDVMGFAADRPQSDIAAPVWRQPVPAMVAGQGF